MKLIEIFGYMKENVKWDGPPKIDQELVEEKLVQRNVERDKREKVNIL
jgi:hypothetical protein